MDAELFKLVSRKDSGVALEDLLPSSESTSEAPSQTCHLLRLPLELRDMIYDLVFSNTRLTYGKRFITGDNTYLALKPCPTSLALLYTCQRINYEIGQSWISKVKFHYRDSRTMLSQLSSVPDSIVARIRHVELVGSFINLSSAFSPGATRRSLAGPTLPFMLLPRLRLDTLTMALDRKIGAGRGGEGSEGSWVRETLECGTGWKTVNFVLSSDEAVSELAELSGSEKEPLPTILDMLTSRPDTVRNSVKLELRVQRLNKGHINAGSKLSLPSIDPRIFAAVGTQPGDLGTILRVTRKDAPTAEDSRRVPGWAEDMSEWAMMRNWRDVSCFDIYNPFMPQMCMGVEIDDGVDGENNRRIML